MANTTDAATGDGTDFSGAGTAPAANNDDGLRWTGRFAGGLIDDLKRRAPWYGDDFRQGLHSKVVGSTLFLYFACLANAIAFGALMGFLTDGQIGTTEMMIATAVGGVAFALFAGQPLTILGGTGPIVIFTAILYTTSNDLGLDFLPVYAWVGVWSGILLMLLAVTDASALMRFFTRFTDEIFAALIAVIFIVEAVTDISAGFTDTDTPYDAALLGLVLAIGTFVVARTLQWFRNSPYLRWWVRDFLADFGPAISIVLMTIVAILMNEVPRNHADVPESFGTTTGRPWMVDMFSVPTWIWIASIIPAVLAVVLLFLDQNITTRLVNAKHHKLKKGSGYHLDLFIVGLIILVCSLFGLPWIVAATVHSLNHVRSLATHRVVDEGGQVREEIVSVRENRMSPLLVHLLIGASLLFLPLVAQIPMSVLFGLFLFMGFATLAGNEFFERVRMWAMDPRLYPTSHHFIGKVPMKVVHAYTAIQVACLGALWALKSSPLGLLFPVLIAMLVPIRRSLSRFFDREHLAALDEEEDAEVFEETGGGRLGP
ncbi:MAG: sodium bicarbonate transporter family protein [Pseudomonadota bacterium]